MKRIIWITGMGIHHEIKGLRGKMLDMYAKQRPEYIKAADTIAASPAITTLLRCPGIKDGNNTKYFLTKEGGILCATGIMDAGEVKATPEIY